jgi:hypothetical protein
LTYSATPTGRNREHKQTPSRPRAAADPAQPLPATLATQATKHSPDVLAGSADETTNTTHNRRRCRQKVRGYPMISTKYTRGYTVKRDGSSYTQWFPYYHDAKFFRDTENRRHNSGWYIVKTKPDPKHTTAGQE